MTREIECVDRTPEAFYEPLLKTFTAALYGACPKEVDRLLLTKKIAISLLSEFLFRIKQEERKGEIIEILYKAKVGAEEMDKELGND